MSVDVTVREISETEQFASHLFQQKYANRGETFYDAMVRIAAALSDSDTHRRALKDALLNQRFLPAGRLQRGAGSVDDVTLANCFVAPLLEDNTESIFDVLTKTFQTLRRGGGVGIDFSKLRPNGSLIKTLGSESSGPLAFMGIFDSTCKTVASAGHRRGAMMGTLRIDHPDIEEFIAAKHDNTTLTAFNMSILVTDLFMDAVMDKDTNAQFPLVHNGEVVRTVNAKALWDKLMRSTYDYAEPGVLFIDTINNTNNLNHIGEWIQCTNPCAEQPLPPNGACVLGSLNLVKYVHGGSSKFDFKLMRQDVKVAVRALDIVHDKGTMPLPEQNEESVNKRRIGLGVTGFGSLLSMMGLRYGSDRAQSLLDSILSNIANQAYTTSAVLAIEKGSFPLFVKDAFMEYAPFIKKLRPDVRRMIEQYGLRNSHLLSMAPTGTISMVAGNVSGGIEPIFAPKQRRKVKLPEGEITVTLKDYALDRFGNVPMAVAEQVTPAEHLHTLQIATYWVDSSVSKTINVSKDVSWDEFKLIYMDAYLGGCKGCTTFRIAGKRFAQIEEVPVEEGEACAFNEDGSKTCDE